MRRLARRSATNPPPDHPGPVRPGARDFPIDLSRRPALRLPAGVREADLAVAAEILAEPALELVDERPDHALLHRHAKLQLADAIVERIGGPMFSLIVFCWYMSHRIPMPRIYEPGRALTIAGGARRRTQVRPGRGPY